MKPSERATIAASITRSKGKMYEYGVPIEYHIEIPQGFILEELFPLAIGTLGDFAAETARKYLNLEPSTVTTSEEVQFAAIVLQAYVDSHLNDKLSFDLLLFGTCAFYLCGMPGNAMVLYRRLSEYSTPEEHELVELISVLRWTLGSPWSSDAPDPKEPFLNQLSHVLRQHFADGELDQLTTIIREMRVSVYRSGSARELLLTDLLSAVVLSRIECSAWTLLPMYSGIAVDSWRSYLKRNESLKELWPSQRLLGSSGVYSGASAIVQMPTSAGKTKATELVIRSAFLSTRTTLSVVVAPFRALCQEITNALRDTFATDDIQINQLSDALQPDYLSEFLFSLGGTERVTPHVVVLTPEKLLYVLRQHPDLVQRIGLVIYDEGHQFDTGARGVTFELLLTSIKRLLGPQAQTVLISAVIQNAKALAAWLLNNAEQVVSDSTTQTQRIVAFASWQVVLGQLRFYDKPGGNQSFYVPRVLIEEQLAVKGEETKIRLFPSRTESGSVALYLALKLAANGGVAIFCGTKPSVSKIVRDAVEAYSRAVSLPAPSTFCNKEELARLCHLYALNFGQQAYLTAAAGLGIFAHHGATPHGLRLAIEHAMRDGLIGLVVCTSTLAQGVNLPIRYLIVTGTQQGELSIKVRDFHNLMGRAGRAGIHGEGTVIFSNPELFDKQNTSRWDRSRWDAVQALLSPEKAEPTGSSLLALLSPLQNDKKTDVIDETPLEVVQALLTNRDQVLEWANKLPEELLKRDFSPKSVFMQLEAKCHVLDAIESFLMSYRGEELKSVFFDTAQALARETFAYALGTADEKRQLEEAFSEVAKQIDQKVPDVKEQARYGRTLLGVTVSLEVDRWVLSKLGELRGCASENDLLATLWPMFKDLVSEKLFREVEPADAIPKLADGWIAGKPFFVLLDELLGCRATYPFGPKKRRKFTIDMVVDLCEGGFGFQLTLLLAAVAEALSVHMAAAGEEKDRLVALMNSLQKRLKYGLPTASAVAMYEVGFAERVVAQAADAATGSQATSTASARQLLRGSTHQVGPVIEQFPAYFQAVYARLTA